jgi:hypothetical protein
MNAIVMKTDVYFDTRLIKEISPGESPIEVSEKSEGDRGKSKANQNQQDHPWRRGSIAGFLRDPTNDRKTGEHEPKQAREVPHRISQVP